MGLYERIRSHTFSKSLNSQEVTGVLFGPIVYTVMRFLTRK